LVKAERGTGVFLMVVAKTKPLEEGTFCPKDTGHESYVVEVGAGGVESFSARKKGSGSV